MIRMIATSYSAVVVLSNTSGEKITQISKEKYNLTKEINKSDKAKEKLKKYGIAF